VVVIRRPEGHSLRSTALPRFVLLYAAMYAAFGVASSFLPAFVRARGPAGDLADFAQAVGPLGPAFGHEGHRGGDKGPCIVTHTAGV
jgi:hypothetical protein